MFLEKAVVGKNQFWRYFVSIILVIVALFVGQIPFGIALVFAQTKGTDISEFSKTMDFESIGVDPNVGLILVILSFFVGFWGLFLAVKLIHEKPFLAIISAAKKFRWNRVFYAIGLWFALSALAELAVYYYDPARYSFDFELMSFLPLLLVSFLFLPFQTSFEEIFIRGYLMQGVGLITRYSWIPLVISSLIFGGLHFMNPEVEQYGLGLMMIYYIGFGIFMAVITIMDDGLELVLGIHAITNIYASVFVSYSGGALQTPALFKLEVMDTKLMLIAWAVISIIFLYIVQRKYNWQNWNKLFKKIDFTDKPVALDPEIHAG